MRRPEWGPIVREYPIYLARQTGPESERPDIRDTPTPLAEAVAKLTQGIEADYSSVERKGEPAYLTGGSANIDYRSMVMDGEVMITVSSWSALSGLVDFLILPGLCVWIDSQEELDELLPPPSGFNRKMANLLKLAL
jgi:hypothetical protein